MNKFTIFLLLTYVVTSITHISAYYGQDAAQSQQEITVTKETLEDGILDVIGRNNPSKPETLLKKDMRVTHTYNNETTRYTVEQAEFSDRPYTTYNAYDDLSERQKNCVIKLLKMPEEDTQRESVILACIILTRRNSSSNNNVYLCGLNPLVDHSAFRRLCAPLGARQTPYRNDHEFSLFNYGTLAQKGRISFFYNGKLTSCTVEDDTNQQAADQRQELRTVRLTRNEDQADIVLTQVRTAEGNYSIKEYATKAVTLKPLPATPVAPVERVRSTTPAVKSNAPAPEHGANKNTQAPTINSIKNKLIFAGVAVALVATAWYAYSWLKKQ